MLKKHFLLLSGLKTDVLLNIFVKPHATFSRFFKSSKEQYLFEIEILRNIINVFAVTFDLAEWR